MSWLQVSGFIATIMSTPPRRPRWPLSLIRTSNQVGRPWMFDGKMFRELTGMPIRSTDLANSALALAEPEPLTLANFTTKSLTAVIAAGRDSDCNVIVSALSQNVVMPGLDPGIQRNRHGRCPWSVDGRVEPGHDRK